ncbi:hypothetical protein QE152_g32153 [Popillia japonica]|uniref:Nuclear envelope membrane protein n=1 Tax=Popillia japonica TaxID=7064 RepID=A0AAW1IZP8_POPJA
MTLKYYVGSIFKICIAGIGFGLAFYTAIKFTLFLSDPNYTISHSTLRGGWFKHSWSLFINMCLLSTFILLHSLMAHHTFKQMLGSYITDIQRSIYVITTALSIQLLLRYWHVIPDIVLWKFTLKSSPVLWIYCIIHATFWLLIYVGCICVDINELLGIKQVYYKLKGLPDPLSQKSYQLRKLYGHMRHPGFSSLSAILWITPIMSLDRLLLATVLTLYMYIAWNTDHDDYQYQYVQNKRKFYELNY